MSGSRNTADCLGEKQGPGSRVAAEEAEAADVWRLQGLHSRGWQGRVRPSASCRPVLPPLGVLKRTHTHTHWYRAHGGTHTWPWSTFSSLGGSIQDSGPQEGGAGAPPWSLFLSLVGEWGLPWNKEKEGGQEEAIVLCIVSCQEGEMASGSK